MYNSRRQQRAGRRPSAGASAAAAAAPPQDGSGGRGGAMLRRTGSGGDADGWGSEPRASRAGASPFGRWSDDGSVDSLHGDLSAPRAAAWLEPGHGALPAARRPPPLQEQARRRQAEVSWLAAAAAAAECDAFVQAAWDARW
eukprot:168655-Chlamydomonas_euryale.AAC.12